MIKIRQINKLVWQSTEKERVIVRLIESVTEWGSEWERGTNKVGWRVTERERLREGERKKREAEGGAKRKN